MSRRNWVVGNGVIQTLGTGCGKESERESERGRESGGRNREGNQNAENEIP